VGLTSNEKPGFIVGRKSDENEVWFHDEKLLLSQSNTPWPTVCPLDCPDSCSLDVTVQDDAWRRSTGSSLNPVTGEHPAESAAVP